MTVIIDRIEQDKAVVELESGKTVVVPMEILSDVREGDKVDIVVTKCNTSENVDTASIFERLRNKSKNAE